MGASSKAVFPGSFESLDDIREFAGQAARKAGLDEKDVQAVKLAVDEACTNVIEHAYGGEDRGLIECRCSVEPEGLVVTIRDHGQPFDPTSVPEPDLTCPLEERQTGGLGLFLINKLMDEVRFESDDDGNMVRLVKRCPAAPPEEQQ